MAVAREEITEPSERELFIAGVVGYWAEGTKNKPWGKNGQVAFINSDPGMIRLFLRWLELLGIGPDRLAFRMVIHESADAQAAVEYWADVVRVAPTEFQKTTLKRHNPTTVRKNTGTHYHGCLSIKVRRSARLNLLIAGWGQGLAEAAGTMMRTRSGMV